MLITGVCFSEPEFVWPSCSSLIGCSMPGVPSVGGEPRVRRPPPRSRLVFMLMLAHTLWLIQDDGIDKRLYHDFG